MTIEEDSGLMRYSARVFHSRYDLDPKRYQIRLDWMLALGTNSMDQGDYRTALKYFKMVLDVDEGNVIAAYYRDLTRKLMKTRSGHLLVLG